MSLLVGVALAPEASAGPDNYHTHIGEVKYTIFEQFGVTATETFISNSYDETYATVRNNQYFDGYCYHSGFPRWNIKKCFYTKPYNGLAKVGIDVVGEFHHSTGIDYQQHSGYRELREDRLQLLLPSRSWLAALGVAGQMFGDALAHRVDCDNCNSVGRQVR